jgi:hypothetical protein
MRTTRPWLALGWLVLAAAPVMGQLNPLGGTIDPTGGPPPEVTAPGRPKAYGLSSDSVYTVAANSTVPLISATTYDAVYPSLMRYRTGGGFYFQAPVTVPTGALVTSFELDGCDESPTLTIGAFLYGCPVGGGNCTTMASVLSGNVEAPGCTQFVDTTILIPTLDQEGFQYSISIFDQGDDPTTRFGAVRVGWRRQVSPSPAVATFPVDVPTTHPQFRFVEALAAAGITSGCGTQIYCPDSPVTRGQMAVFLTAALGLHWPN